MKSRDFQQFKLTLSNPLVICSRYSPIEYITDTLEPSEVCSILENQNDFFDLLRSAQLKFDGQTLEVNFPFMKKTKTLRIGFKLSTKPKKWEDVVQELRIQRDNLVKEHELLKIRLAKAQNSLQKLEEQQKENIRNLEQWHQTHCGSCGKYVQPRNDMRIRRSQVCSRDCYKRVSQNEKKSFFDFELV